MLKHAISRTPAEARKRFEMAHMLSERGLDVKLIARLLKVDPYTVTRYLRDDTYEAYIDSYYRTTPTPGSNFNAVSLAKGCKMSPEAILYRLKAIGMYRPDILRDTEISPGVYTADMLQLMRDLTPLLRSGKSIRMALDELVDKPTVAEPQPIDQAATINRICTVLEQLVAEIRSGTL